MHKAPTKKQVEVFIKTATDCLERIGSAVPEEARSYVVTTRGGPLLVHIYDDWLACRFDDVALAKKVFGKQLQFNQYSGKWNWHGLDVVPAFERQVMDYLQVANASPSPNA
jgi:hypothetical protein